MKQMTSVVVQLRCPRWVSAGSLLFGKNKCRMCCNFQKTTAGWTPGQLPGMSVFDCSNDYRCYRRTQWLYTSYSFILGAPVSSTSIKSADSVITESRRETGLCWQTQLQHWAACVILYNWYFAFTSYYKRMTIMPRFSWKSDVTLRDPLRRDRWMNTLNSNSYSKQPFCVKAFGV